jgi:hypothetical protein
MHPRVSLHQVAFISETTAAFIAHCRAIGMAHVTLMTPKLRQPGDLELVGPRIAANGSRAATRRAAEHLSGILVRLGA